jgi:hypothetical protein
MLWMCRISLVNLFLARRRVDGAGTTFMPWVGGFKRDLWRALDDVIHVPDSRGGFQHRCRACQKSTTRASHWHTRYNLKMCWRLDPLTGIEFRKAERKRVNDASNDEILFWCSLFRFQFVEWCTFGSTGGVYIFSCLGFCLLAPFDVSVYGRHVSWGFTYNHPAARVILVSYFSLSTVCSFYCLFRAVPITNSQRSDQQNAQYCMQRLLVWFCAVLLWFEFPYGNPSGIETCRNVQSDIFFPPMAR